PLADKTIKQGGFSNVGSPDYSDQREWGLHDVLRGTSLPFCKIAHQMMRGAVSPTRKKMVDLSCLWMIYIRTNKTGSAFENQMIGSGPKHFCFLTSGSSDFLFWGPVAKQLKETGEHYA